MMRANKLLLPTGGEFAATTATAATTRTSVVIIRIIEHDQQTNTDVPIQHTTVTGCCVYIVISSAGTRRLAINIRHDPLLT